MTSEDKIANDLTEKFRSLSGKIRVQRARRIMAEVDKDSFEEVLGYAIKILRFSILCTITGLDERQSIGLIYHIARTDGIVLSIKTSVSYEKPLMNTITPYFPAAEIYEREIADLLGVEIAGLGPGNRYPLPDNWPKGEYPLRKNWKKNASANNIIKERTDNA
ncbi:MAG: NADH-quinone oxidoreductase subunit C [Candidatus Omnitrophica bacterium]|nr:NADH-quinone oxidoreductase subunit C [Candidatus Omnitrophota bacterium]